MVRISDLLRLAKPSHKHYLNDYGKNKQIERRTWSFSDLKKSISNGCPSCCIIGQAVQIMDPRWQDWTKRLGSGTLVVLFEGRIDSVATFTVAKRVRESWTKKSFGWEDEETYELFSLRRLSPL